MQRNCVNAPWGRHLGCNLCSYYYCCLYHKNLALQELIDYFSGGDVCGVDKTSYRELSMKKAVRLLVADVSTM